MPIKKYLNEIIEVNLGTTQIDKVYLGYNLLYESVGINIRRVSHNLGVTFRDCFSSSYRYSGDLKLIPALYSGLYEILSLTYSDSSASVSLFQNNTGVPYTNKLIRPSSVQVSGNAYTSWIGNNFNDKTIAAFTNPLQENALSYSTLFNIGNLNRIVNVVEGQNSSYQTITLLTGGKAESISSNDVANKSAYLVAANTVLCSLTHNGLWKYATFGDKKFVIMSCTMDSADNKNYMACIDISGSSPVTTTYLSPIQNSSAINEIYLVYSGSHFLLFSPLYGSSYWLSDDGINWTMYHFPMVMKWISRGYLKNTSTVNPPKLWALGTNGIIFISSDGINWIRCKQELEGFGYSVFPIAVTYDAIVVGDPAYIWVISEE